MEPEGLTILDLARGRHVHVYDATAAGRSGAHSRGEEEEGAVVEEGALTLVLCLLQS